MQTYWGVGGIISGGRLCAMPPCHGGRRCGGGGMSGDWCSGEGGGSMPGSIVPGGAGM
jgi:hypothetical protein